MLAGKKIIFWLVAFSALFLLAVNGRAENTAAAKAVQSPVAISSQPKTAGGPPSAASEYVPEPVWKYIVLIVLLASFLTYFIGRNFGDIDFSIDGFMSDEADEILILFLSVLGYCTILTFVFYPALMSMDLFGHYLILTAIASVLLYFAIVRNKADHHSMMDGFKRLLVEYLIVFYACLIPWYGLILIFPKTMEQLTRLPWLFKIGIILIAAMDLAVNVWKYKKIRAWDLKQGEKISTNAYWAEHNTGKFYMSATKRQSGEWVPMAWFYIILYNILYIVAAIVAAKLINWKYAGFVSYSGLLWLTWIALLLRRKQS